jgi:hypothetical protein
VISYRLPIPVVTICGSIKLVQGVKLSRWEVGAAAGSTKWKRSENDKSAQFATDMIVLTLLLRLRAGLQETFSRFPSF